MVVVHQIPVWSSLNRPKQILGIESVPAMRCDVAVQEGEVGRSRMPVGWLIPPLVGGRYPESEAAGINSPFGRLDETKNQWRFVNLALLEDRARQRWVTRVARHYSATHENVAGVASEARQVGTGLNGRFI